LNLLVGTFPTTTVTLILSSGERDKDVVSLPVHALLPASASSAPVLLEVVLTPVVVVVTVLLILDLTTVSGSTPVIVTIVITTMVTLTPDFPLSKVSEDLLNLSASLVPLTPRALDLKPVSASSTLAVDQAAVLSLPLMSVVSPLPVTPRVTSQSLDTVVSLTAPTQLNTAALSVRESAPVDAWVEVLATVVSVFVTRVLRVRIVPSSPN